MDREEWEEVAEGMTGFGLSGRGEQAFLLCPLQVMEPVGPCSSLHPSHALSWGGLMGLCLLVMRSTFQGFVSHRVCEGLFPLLPSLSGNWRDLFIPHRSSELLDPLGPCHYEIFCSPLHVSQSLLACLELFVGPWRDLDCAPDLNI